MTVIAYYPPKGIIETLLVQDVSGRCQTIGKQSNSASWYVSDRWSSGSIKKACIDRGFEPLAEPVDFDFFVKNINQFEGKKS